MEDISDWFVVFNTLFQHIHCYYNLHIFLKAAQITVAPFINICFDWSYHKNLLHTC